MVTTALSALDRRNPPPSVVSGARNRIMSTATRLVSRRRVVKMVASLSAPNAAAK